MNLSALAPILATLVAAIPPSGVGDPSVCTVRIEIPASTFNNSHAAHPHLRDETGAKLIYLARAVSPTIQVVRVTGTDATQGLPVPVSYEVKASSLSNLDEVAYHLGSDDFPGIDWESVGVPTGPGGFKVPAGTYRFKLTYAMLLPKEQRGPMVHLCTVYSPAFALLSEEGWTTFR